MNSQLDPVETREWLESFDALKRVNGEGASSELIGKLTAHARDQGVSLPAAITTPFSGSCRAISSWSVVFGR